MVYLMASLHYVAEYVYKTPTIYFSYHIQADLRHLHPFQLWIMAFVLNAFSLTEFRWLWFDKHGEQ